MRDVTEQLDRSIDIVASTKNEEEFVRYRRLAGRFMGDIFLDIPEPVYAEHPDPTPNELRHNKQ